MERVSRYRADVWIKDGKIAQIGGRAPGFAKQVIDADWVDRRAGLRRSTHHYDAQIRWDPYCTIPDARRYFRRAWQLWFRLRAG